MRHAKAYIPGIALALTLSASSLFAQYLSEPGQLSQISESISLKSSSIPFGKAPTVIVKTTNVGKSPLDVRASFEELPRVEGENGELSKTYYHRQRRHEAGLPELDIGPGGLFDKPLAPNEVVEETVDLSLYYVFKTPGKYTVYIEVMERFGRSSFRTNAVTFEILPPAQ